VVKALSVGMPLLLLVASWCGFRALAADAAARELTEQVAPGIQYLSEAGARLRELRAILDGPSPMRGEVDRVWSYARESLHAWRGLRIDDEGQAVELGTRVAGIDGALGRLAVDWDAHGAETQRALRDTIVPAIDSLAHDANRLLDREARRAHHLASGILASRQAARLGIAVVGLALASAIALAWMAR
jgi:hypothetical protein